MNQVHSSWRLLTFRDVAHFVNGYAFKPSDWKRTGLPIIRIQNLNDLEKEFNYFDGKIDERYLVKDGDILISWSASLGVFVWNRGDAVLNQHIFKVLPDERIVDRDFFYYCAQTKLAEMSTRVHGSTMKHITKEPFLNIELLIPPITAQKRIVALLKQADSLKQKRECTNKMTNNLLQAIFVQMFGDMEKNQENWKSSKIDSISSKVTDGEHVTPKRTSSGIKLLSARNIKNGYIDFEEDLDYVSIEEYERISKRIKLEVGDVLISCSGTIGRVTAISTTEPLTIVRSVALVKPKRNLVNSKYLEVYLQTNYMQRLMKQYAHGSSQSNLFTGQIKKLPVVLPPLEMQKEFESIANRIDSLKKRQEQSTNEVDLLFNSLMSKAFKGELVS